MTIFSKRFLENANSIVTPFSGTAKIFGSISYKKAGETTNTYQKVASIDGYNWYQVEFLQQFGVDASIYSIQNSTTWIAVVKKYDTSGNYQSADLYKTTNGVTWTKGALPSITETELRYYINQMFYVGGYFYFPCNTTLYKSSNLSTWTTSSFTYDTTPSYTELGHPKYGGNNTFFMVQGQQFYKSTNGLHWTLIGKNNIYAFVHCACDLSGFAVGYAFGTMSFANFYTYNYGESKEASSKIQIYAAYPSVTDNFLMVWGKRNSSDSYKAYKITKTDPDTYTEITTIPATLDGYSQTLNMYFASDGTTMYSSTDGVNYSTVNISTIAPNGATNIRFLGVIT